MPQDPTQQFYDAHAGEYERKTASLQPVKWIELFMELLPERAEILELGCASGRDARTFLERGFGYLGVDFSVELIRRAKVNVPGGTFLVQDIRALEVPQEHFGGVWMSASLLHIPKKEVPLVLWNIHEALKTGGILFISVQAGEGEGLEPDQRFDDAEKFYAYFQRGELVEMLEAGGFNCEQIEVREARPGYEKRGYIELIARRMSMEKVA